VRIFQEPTVTTSTLTPISSHIRPKTLALAVLGIMTSAPVFAQAYTCGNPLNNTTIDTNCSTSASLSWTGGDAVIGVGITVSGSADPQIIQTGNATSLYVRGAIDSVETRGTLTSVDAVTVGASARISRLVNLGTYGNDDGDGSVRLFPGATITEFWNLGSISPGVEIGIQVYTDGHTDGSIGTLINAQGGASPLVYSGIAPNKYATYFSNSSTYGKVSFVNLSAYTLNTYGVRIASGQNWASGTYSSVITSDVPLTISNLESISGITYQLVTPDSGRTWNLVVETVSPSRVYEATQSLTNTPAGPAARIIDATPQLLTYFANLTTAQQLSDATTQTLPLLTGGSQIASQNALNGINRVIQARISANRGLSSGDVFSGDKNFWIKPFGSRAKQDTTDGVAGYKAETYGLAGGFDGTVGSATRLGLAFAYASSNIDSNSSVARQSADVNVYQLVGYGSYSLDERTELNFQIDAGRNSNDGKRTIAFTNTVAKSDYNSTSAHIGAGLGRTYAISQQTSLIPSVRADYTWVRDDSYREKGAGLLNLNVNERSTRSFVIGADGKVSHQMNDRTTLTANIGVGYDTLNERSSITAAFAGAPGAAFVTHGIKPSPWIGQAGFGLVHQASNGMEISGRYDAEHRTGFLNHTASLKVRWAF